MDDLEKQATLGTYDKEGRPTEQKHNTENGKDYQHGHHEKTGGTKVLTKDKQFLVFIPFAMLEAIFKV